MKSVHGRATGVVADRAARTRSVRGTWWRRVAGVGLAMPGLAGVLAAAAAQPAPQRVDLWLSMPPLGGDLRACAADEPARQWRLAAGDAQLSPDRGGYRLQQLGADAGRDEGWTQRCFQLRDGIRVLLQGALVPAMSARRLPPPLWVAVLENRARHVPEIVVGCGYPVAGYAPAGCGPGLKPASMP